MTGRYEMLVEQNAEVPMRDGAILRANVYRPDADARFPVINLAELGRLDESQETVARLLELEPNLRFRFCAGGRRSPTRSLWTCSSTAYARRDRWIAGLLDCRS